MHSSVLIGEREMNLRKGSITIVALLAVPAAGYGIWRQTGGIRKASAGPGVIEAAPQPPLISPALSLGMPLTPRLVATWATRVGPYSVGIGSLRPTQDNRRFLGRLGFQLS